MSGIPSGNNLISRLSGMLVKEYLHTPLGNIEIFWGYLTFLKADSRLTLLGESMLTCWLTLWGIKISWLHSSAELTLVPWWTEQLDRLDNSLLPLFLTLPVINPLFLYAIYS